MIVYHKMFCLITIKSGPITKSYNVLTLYTIRKTYDKTI